MREIVNESNHRDEGRTEAEIESFSCKRQGCDGVAEQEGGGEQVSVIIIISSKEGKGTNKLKVNTH